MGANNCESTFDECATLCRPVHGIIRTIRDLRPTHSLFKVVSYSLLEDDKYESDVFQAGDYKWKLCLYPNGDINRNGDGYVSLYLTITETDTLPCGWEVKADFKLFVFDQIRDKYLTIQDSGEGAIRRFHETKSQWGFSQLVPLSIVKDVSNGYLIDDCCVFGAEVFVLNKCTDFKFCCLAPKAKEPPKDTYVWEMKNISKLQDNKQISEVFVLAGREWMLRAYLKGTGIGTGKAMSLFLAFDDVPTVHTIYVEYILSIIDQVHKNDYKKTGSFLYTDRHSKGLFEFIPIEQLHDPSNGFVKNDTLIIEFQLTKLSLMDM